MTDPIIDDADPDVARAMVAAADTARLKGVGRATASVGGARVVAALKRAVDHQNPLVRWQVMLRLDLESVTMGLEEADWLLHQQAGAMNALFTKFRTLSAPLADDDYRVEIDDSYSEKEGEHHITKGRWRTALWTINIPFERMYGEDLNALLRG